MARPALNALRRGVFFPFLLPFFYVLHGLRYYFGNIPIGDATQVFLLYIIISGALFLLARLVLKRNVGAGLLALLLMILTLYWAEIVRTISRWTGWINYTHLPALLLLWLGTSYLCARALARSSNDTRQRVTLLLNLFFVINILIEGGWITVKLLNPHSAVFLQQTITPVQSRTTKASKQDVYLLLFDEYSSSPTLRDLYGYNNSGIDSFLIQRHFALRPQSRANYQLTFFSLATMLNMEYLSPAIAQAAIHQPKEVDAYRSIRESKVVAAFSNAGYQFFNYSIFDIAGQPKPYLYDLISTGRTILTVNNLAHVAQRDYLPYLQYRQTIHQNAAFHDPGLYAFDSYNKATVKRVCSLAATTHAKPQFVYAHFLMPHAPFYYDSADAYLSPPLTKTTSIARQPRLYGYNVRHANTEMMRMVDTIMQRSNGNAVVLILSDHGFRSELAEGRRKDALFQNLFAVYFPDGDYRSIPAAPTNVNVFRIVLNKLLGTSYPLLADTTIELKGGGW